MAHRPSPVERRCTVKRIYDVLYGAVAFLFALAALVLIVFSGREMWLAVDPRHASEIAERVKGVLESIGLLTIAVVALELSQTVIEEEIRRVAQISAPTRVRRFLSRFLVVVVVALGIEALVSAFGFAHESPDRLSQSAMIAFAAAAILAAWGVFVYLNGRAEELEPEAMAEVKREDENLDAEADRDKVRR
jgi:arginine exporter protein ArgO